MKNKFISILFVLSAALSVPSPVRAQIEISSAGFPDAQSAGEAGTQEDQLYAKAKSSLDDGEYGQAISGFDEVTKLHGRKADGALYWKAYALNKAGDRGQALAALGELRRIYPKSNWLRDAGSLEQEMHGPAPDPEKISDEDLKLLALQSLMNTDPERAIPLLEKVIQGNQPVKLKDRALFVLSQSNSEKAQQIFLNLARSGNQPELQKRAIRYMGMSGNGRYRTALKETYNSSTEAGVKKAVFQAWLMSGNKDDLLAAARTEKNPELRREAIRYVGMTGGKTELRQLYKDAGDAETKNTLLQAMMMAGDKDGLSEAATTEKDQHARAAAIRNLGLVGGSPDTLLKIYNSNPGPETRKEVINALFLHGAGKEMVALARKETDPQVRRELIQKMSLMRSPEISEYMMEILNK
jgi:HEAT repeat protein